MGATLNAMLGRLEGALARERRFVADASHELRTPLAILKAEIHLALVEGRSPAELTAALESVGEETDRLSRLADDLLVLARADEGRLPVEREPVRLAELAGRVAERAGARSEPKVTVSIADEIVVSADPLRLEQALANLIDNALRHGNGEVSVEARADNARGLAEIHVIDGGEGFSEELLSRAFERFARAENGRPSGGAGLGLAIVEAIATAHGGSVHARNQPQGGADVWLEIPLAVEKQGAASPS